MHSYRIYILTLQDRIAEILEAVFATDREALEAAEDRAAGAYAAEVWSGERLVARLGGELTLA